VRAGGGRGPTIVLHEHPKDDAHVARDARDLLAEESKESKFL
jgi:hypothetical protein